MVPVPGMAAFMNRNLFQGHRNPSVPGALWVRCAAF
jgi:hypothetical protein